MYAIRQFQHKSGPELHAHSLRLRQTAGLDGMLTSGLLTIGAGVKGATSLTLLRVVEVVASPVAVGVAVTAVVPAVGVVAVAAVPVVVEVAGLVAAVPWWRWPWRWTRHGRRRKSSLQRRPDDRGDRHLNHVNLANPVGTLKLAVLWRVDQCR